ncbi:hypothetical protein [Salsuginibacillus kocurii]|uniref:hypothetical protein n=1 Tax=Salsuginibacillus kocurii TaxID=427078 RepID=UPI000376E6F6|nr:hypothetical protein [Salsuginibacillus kocurii]
MDERKQIVIDEIKYWKQNHLLPSEYCDFLLMLYSEGEETSAIDSSDEARDKKVYSWFHLLWLTCSIFFVISAVVVTVGIIYFTEFSMLVQILLSIIFASAVLLLALFLKERYFLLSHFFIFTFALLVFLISSHLASEFFPHTHAPVLIIVALNCMSWLAAGWYWRLNYFLIAGILGVLLLIGFVVLL